MLSWRAPLRREPGTERGTPVLDAYAAERPGVLEQLRELDALERSLDGSVIGRVSASMAFRVRKPEELRDVYSELALRNLADG